MTTKVELKAVEQRVIEMWPRLSKSWDSIGPAIQHYANPINRARLVLEMKAWSKDSDNPNRATEDDHVSAARHRQYVDQTPIGRATAGILHHARAGRTLSEIIDNTRDECHAVTGDHSGWAESAIGKLLMRVGEVQHVRRLFGEVPVDPAQEWAKSQPTER